MTRHRHHRRRPCGPRPGRCAARRRPPGHAGPSGDVPTSAPPHVLLCVPDGEIAAAAAAVPPRDGRLVGHVSGATTLEPLAAHEAFSLHPLMTVTARRPPPASSPARAPPSRARPPRALARSPSELAADLGMTAVRGPRRGPRRLPRGRVDRLELPRHARGRRRAAARPRPRGARPARPRDRRELGRASAPSARSPARSPAATRPRSPASAPRSPSARPSCSRSSTRSPHATRDLAAAGRRRHEDRPHRRRRPRRASPTRPRPVGLVPTMGALHDGHLALVARGPRAAARRSSSSLFVNPTQFNEQSDLAGYPRDEERDAALAAEAGADLLFAPGVDEVYPPGFATTVSVARHHRAARGRPARHRALRRRRDRRHQAPQHGRPRRGVLRPEGRPAGRGHPPLRPRPRHPGARSRSSRPSASPTAWRCRAATSTSTATTASARSP